MKYAVRGDDADWDSALAQTENGGAVVQVKSKKPTKLNKEVKDTDSSNKEHKHKKRSGDGDSDHKKSKKKSKKGKYANLS